MKSNVATGYLLKRVQSALRQTMDSELAGDGLTMAQYAVMSNLAREPDSTNAELARRSFVTPQTMIRIVKSLEDDGWIRSHTDPTNRRRQLYSITAEGRQRLAGAERTTRAIERRMTEGLSATDIRSLRALLEQCLENLETTGGTT